MKKFEDRIRVYLEERGWDKLRPADLAKSIVIEGGELLELFQWENLSLEEIKNNPDKVKEIKKELADVMTYCVDMAVILDVDVEDMLNEKLDKVIEKYPASLFNKNSRGSNQDPGTEAAYWEVKQKFRKEGKN
jgi:NTP pyrophosphatase (non-canonical NTP hydrolase)